MSSKNVSTELVKNNGSNQSNEYNLKAMDELKEIILNNQTGDQLSLVRTNTKALEQKRFREIAASGNSIVSKTVQGTSPVMAQAQTINDINKLAPNGLFTATAPTSKLMRFNKDGTYGSALMEKGRITGQKGFKKINPSESMSPINPGTLIGASMQAMAAVSGQYYMHQITRDLKSIKGEIDKLVSYHHDEKTANLLTVKERLMKITEKHNIDASDIIELRQLNIIAREVFNEYHIRLERMNLDYIYNEKVNQLTKVKRMKELVNLIEDKEINYTIQLCFYADYLSLQCELAEISTRMKSSNMTDQTAIIKERIQALHENYLNSFVSNIEEEIDKKYNPVLSFAKLLKEKNLLEQKIDKYYKNKIPQLEKELEKLKNNLVEKIPNEKNNSINKILIDLEKPKEILYMLSEDYSEQRVFIADKE